MRSARKNFVSVFVLSVVFIIACNNSETKTKETVPLVKETGEIIFDKLLGTWKNNDSRGFERWTKNDNGTYHSVVFSLKGSDTSWNEHADIYPEAGKWVYENTVKDQNDGKAVKFVSSILTETSVQFSNPEHDFPTDINYTVPDANTINAFIVGPNGKGGKDTIPFNFMRVN